MCVLVAETVNLLGMCVLIAKTVNLLGMFVLIAETVNLLGMCVCVSCRDSKPFRHVCVSCRDSKPFRHVCVSCRDSKPFRHVCVLVAETTNLSNLIQCRHLFIVALHHFDALLCKNIYGFRKRVYNIENDLVKCVSSCVNIVNGPGRSRCAKTLYYGDFISYLYLIIYYILTY